MRSIRLFACLIGIAFCSTAAGQVVRIGKAEFLPGAGRITFSEKPNGIANPTYVPADYGGGAGAPTVTFDGFFEGQSLGNASPPCPVGAALTGCVIGSPTNPLTLDAAAPDTFISTDLSQPTSPVLSGSPLFNGPIGILFSNDVAAVGLDGGFFNAPASTGITAYRRDGSLLGSVTNVGLGIEFVGLRTASGNNEIAGLLFSLQGPEPAGFDIDNLQFGTTAQIVPIPPAATSIPVPALSGWPLGALGLLLAGFAVPAFRRRRG